MLIIIATFFITLIFFEPTQPVSYIVIGMIVWAAKIVKESKRSPSGS